MSIARVPLPRREMKLLLHKSDWDMAGSRSKRAASAASVPAAQHPRLSSVEHHLDLPCGGGRKMSICEVESNCLDPWPYGESFIRRGHQLKPTLKNVNIQLRSVTQRGSISSQSLSGRSPVRDHKSYLPAVSARERRFALAHKITLIPGDGTGPEITEATRRVIEATGVEIEWEVLRPAST